MNEKKQQAILMMSEGMMFQEIAKKLTVTPKTISEWRSEPEFRATLNQYLENMQSAHSEKLRNLQGIALQTIQDCLNNPEYSPKEKLTAAFKILALSGISVTQPGSSSAVQLIEEDNLLKIFLN